MSSLPGCLPGKRIHLRMERLPISASTALFLSWLAKRFSTRSYAISTMKRLMANFERQLSG